MRELFLQKARALEIKDAQFRESFSERTTIDTAQETWSVTPDTAVFLYDLVLKEKPKQIVEVGTSLGYSTMWLAEAAQTYGGNITTIEYETVKLAAAQALFDALGYQETVSLLHGDARDVLEAWSAPVDVLFLDAKKREYLPCLKRILPQLPIGALVVADDVIAWRRKVEDFFAYMEESGLFETEILAIGHGISVSRRIA